MIVQSVSAQFRALPRLARQILHAAAVVAAAVVLGYVVRSTLGGAHRIQGHSMEPTLHDGQLVFVMARPLAGARVRERGRVVSLWVRGEGLLVKRVVATGGQRVEARGDTLYVNDARVVARWSTLPGTGTWAAQVPLGGIFVLGDNRANSADSRVFGPVPERSLRGIVIGQGRD